jgi:hypothetical protein
VSVIPGLICPKCGEENLRRGGTEFSHSAGSMGRARYRCRDEACRWHGTQPIGLDQYDAGIDREKADANVRAVREARGIRRFVITSAQNATPIHEPFMNALQAYCRHAGAKLLVIPYRYKNPTSRWSKKASEDDWWDERLKSHMIDRSVKVNQNLTLLADIKTQPTAANPLEGLETISGALSAIVGHPKIELISVPTPHKRMPKILTTTGAVTRLELHPFEGGQEGRVPPYVRRHRRRSRWPLFFMRQLIAARDGSFCDLAHEYFPDGRREKARAKAIVMGDWHNRFADPGVRAATFESKGCMMDVLAPEHLVWHDFHDQDSQNHHDRNDPFLNVVKRDHGLDVVEHELFDSLATVDALHRPGTINVFPFSNHPNEHLERWLRETDWRRDPANAAFYLRTALAMVEGGRWTPNGAKTVDPLVYWAEKKLKCIKHCRFLGPDDSYVVGGVELAMHGHLGPNGARGSIRAFGKIGVRSIVGHSHGPGIKDGVMQVGTSSQLRLGYNKGPSSWLHAHGALYRNGKRSLLVIINGRWRA